MIIKVSSLWGHFEDILHAQQLASQKGLTRHAISPSFRRKGGSCVLILVVQIATRRVFKVTEEDGASFKRAYRIDLESEINKRAVAIFFSK